MTEIGVSCYNKIAIKRLVKGEEEGQGCVWSNFCEGEALEKEKNVKVFIEDI